MLAAYERATHGEGRGAAMFEGEMIDEANRKMAERLADAGRAAGYYEPARPVGDGRGEERAQRAATPTRAAPSRTCSASRARSATTRALARADVHAQPAPASRSHSRASRTSANVS